MKKAIANAYIKNQCRTMLRLPITFLDIFLFGLSLPRTSLYFRRLFSQKSVAVVGSSPDLLGRSSGKEIDDHDLVVRFNLSSPKISVNIDDTGTKTDVQFVGATLLQKHNPFIDTLTKCLLITTTKNKRFMRHNGIDCFYYHKSMPKWFNQLAGHFLGLEWYFKAFTKPPRSGLVFLLLLLRFGRPKSVDVYGFSSSLSTSKKFIGYTDGLVKNYDQNLLLKCHLPVQEEVKILKLLEEKNLITLRK